jgi:serine protease Do
MRTILTFPRFFAVLVMTALLLPATPVLARSGPPGFADLAEKALPAVVNISTTQMINERDDMEEMPEFQLPPGSPFEKFFKDFMDKQKGAEGGKPHKRKANALGSGFVIDPSGYIVTNNHVIQDADEITVILQDDTNWPAKLIGRDKKTDLALLKVESKKPLASIAWGDSDKARVGDWIIAIGNPYGLGGTVTAGIISARSRDINSGPYDEYLQTDAPINRGNSGGPMLNMDGEIVGVNTAIFSPSGGSIGIGFAIPSSLAKNIVDQLREHGKIRRGWLGVHIQTVTQDIAEGLNLGKPRGALVSSVNPDGPAGKAGVQQGDVILTFDGKEVPDMHRLPLMVAETDVEKTVDMTVFRKGQEIPLKVKIGELQGKDDAEEAKETGKDQEPAAPNAEKIGELGLTVTPLTDALRKRFDIDKGTKGVVVSSVSEDGIAAEDGIEIGDVVTEAGQQEVKSTKAFADQVKEAKKNNKTLLLLISRKDDLRFVAITFGKKKQN